MVCNVATETVGFFTCTYSCSEHITYVFRKLLISASISHWSQILKILDHRNQAKEYFFFSPLVLSLERMCAEDKCLVSGYFWENKHSMSPTGDGLD